MRNENLKIYLGDYLLRFCEDCTKYQLTIFLFVILVDDDDGMSFDGKSFDLPYITESKIFSS